MAMTQVVPTSPEDRVNLVSSVKAEHSIGIITDKTQRIQLTKPPDTENELIRVAAEHGPSGVFAAIRARRDYGWFVVLGLRAIEVCVSPVRGASSPAGLEDCDPIGFAMQLLEMELIGEVFELCRHYEHIKDAQRAGLAIVELLVMDDPEWRDEVARRGGIPFLCDVAKLRKDSPRIMCQVMMCMAYLAAENYIEVMLCQHDALEYVAYALKRHPKNSELVTRTSLALLNLTVCEPHVEELLDKQALPCVVAALDEHGRDIHVVIILCGVLANLSVHSLAQEQLVELGVLGRVRDAMHLDLSNAVLQVACLKALVNYSTIADVYMKMEDLEIPKLVGKALVEHARDPEVQRYGNYFLGNHTSCFVM